MSFQTLSLPDLVTQALQLHLAARDNAEIAATLVPRYYETADLLAGHVARIETLERQMSVEATERADATRATDAVEKAEDALAGRYGADRELGRANVPPSSDAYQALGLRGRMPSSRSGLLREASAFYTKLVERPDLAALVPGMTPEAAQQGLDLGAALRAEQQEQNEEAGEFETQRDERQRTEASVRREAAKLARIARVVFKDRPDLLNLMGL